MDALLVVGLFLVAALLFYKFVERRHKVLFVKVLIAIFALCVVGVALLYAIARQSDAKADRRRRSVQITFVRDSVAAPNTVVDRYLREIYGADTVASITFKLCNSGEDTVEYMAFNPKTLRDGRSTEHDVVIAGPGSYNLNQLVRPLYRALSVSQHYVAGRELPRVRHSNRDRRLRFGCGSGEARSSCSGNVRTHEEDDRQPRAITS